MCRTWASNLGPLACQADSLPIELPHPVAYQKEEQKQYIDFYYEVLNGTDEAVARHLIVHSQQD